MLIDLPTGLSLNIFFIRPCSIKFGSYKSGFSAEVANLMDSLLILKAVYFLKKKFIFFFTTYLCYI